MYYEERNWQCLFRTPRVPCTDMRDDDEKEERGSLQQPRNKAMYSGLHGVLAGAESFFFLSIFLFYFIPP